MTEVEKHSTINNHETIEEVDEDQSLENTKEPSWQERIQKLAIQASSNLLGQFVIRQSDRLLWTVEKTANWSCPLEKATKNPKDKQPTLIRPLPWLLFLPALVALRLSRVALSLCSILVGYKSISANDLVIFFQSCRRELRAIKYEALRNIRLQQEAASSNDNQTAANSNKFTQSLLVNIMRSICLRQAIDEDVHRVVVKKNKKGEGKSALDVKTKVGSNKRNRPVNDDNDLEDEDELSNFLNKTFTESDSDDSIVFDLDQTRSSTSSDQTVSSENEEDVENNEKEVSKSVPMKNDQHAEQKTNGGTNDITNGENKANSQTSSSDSGIGHQNHKYHNGSLSDDGKNSNNSHENNKEFKRTDSAPLTNYSKTNGDGAGDGVVVNNDDAFYSPIGSPTPDNAKYSNDESPVTNNRDNKYEEVPNQSQQHSQQQQTRYYASNNHKSCNRQNNGQNRKHRNGNSNNNGHQQNGGQASAPNGSRNGKRN